MSLPWTAAKVRSTRGTRFTWRRVSWPGRSGWTGCRRSRASHRSCRPSAPRAGAATARRWCCGGSYMGYFVAYVIEGQERPEDGDAVASGTGWLDWADWASGLAKRYPQAAHLAEEGWLEPAEALDALEHELEELRHEKGGPKGAAAVTGNLLA